MNSKQHHHGGQGGHSYQRHGASGQQTAAGSGAEHAPPTTKFLPAKLPQAPLNFEDIYKDTSSTSAPAGGSETKSKKKVKQNASPEASKTAPQAQQPKSKNTSRVSAVSSSAGGPEESHPQSHQKTKQKSNQLQLQNQPQQSHSAQKLSNFFEESKSAAAEGRNSFVGNVQRSGDQKHDPSVSSFFHDELTLQHNTSMPKLQTQSSSSNQQSNFQYQWASGSQTNRDGGNHTARRHTTKQYPNSNKKQKGGDLEKHSSQIVEPTVRKSEFTSWKPNKRRGRVIEPTTPVATDGAADILQQQTSAENSNPKNNKQQNEGSNVTDKSKNDGGQKVPEDGTGKVAGATGASGSQGAQDTQEIHELEAMKHQIVKSSPRKTELSKNKEEQDQSANESSQLQQDNQISLISPKKKCSKQDFAVQDVKILDQEDAKPSVIASASKAKGREREAAIGSSPLGQQQTQQQSQRSSSEVIQKKSRKQATASGVMVPGASKPKKHFDKQEKQKLADELVNTHRNVGNFGSKKKDNEHFLKTNRDRDGSSQSLKGSIGVNEDGGNLSGQRRRNQRGGTISSSNQIDDRDKHSDDHLTITPKKDMTGEHIDEKIEDPTNKNQLKRHYVDLDKNGGRELLVISITVKNRIIEATVRQNTDLSKLYERISLLGDFQNYPGKFKDIFFKYWKNLIDDAEKLLKEEEQREKAKKGALMQSVDEDGRKVKVISSPSKKGDDRGKPMLQVSGLASQSEQKPHPQTTKNFNLSRDEAFQRFQSPQTPQSAAPGSFFQQNSAIVGGQQYHQLGQSAADARHSLPPSQSPDDPQATSGQDKSSLMLPQFQYMQGGASAGGPLSTSHLAQHLSPQNIESLLQQNFKMGGFGQPQVPGTAGLGAAQQDQLIQYMIQQQQNQVLGLRDGKVGQNQIHHPQGFNPPHLMQPMPGQSPPFGNPFHPAHGFQQQQLAPGQARWEETDGFKAKGDGAEAGGDGADKPNTAIRRDDQIDPADSTEDHDNASKKQREPGSSPGYGQSSKDESIASKSGAHGHKGKKIKQKQVVEYQAQNKKESSKVLSYGSQRQLSTAQVSQSNDPYSHMMSSSEQFMGGQPESIQGMTTGSGADGETSQADFSHKSESSAKVGQKKAANSGHGDLPSDEPAHGSSEQKDTNTQSSSQVDLSSATGHGTAGGGHAQAQKERKKMKKMASQRKKEDPSYQMMIQSQIEGHSASFTAQSNDVGKQGSFEPLHMPEQAKADENFNQNLIQSSDQNSVSNYLKVDQESGIKPVNSAASNSDLQSQLSHAMQQPQLDPLLQQFRLPQVNNVSFDPNSNPGGGQPQFQGGNGQQNHAGNNGANIFVGQGLLNHNLAQIAQNQGQTGGNTQMMNFTFNNFNNHTMAGGLQPQNNQQQLLANHLNAQQKQQFPQITISPNYGNTSGNFVSHINNIGAIGINVNNFNIKLNNGQQMNSIPQLAGHATSQQFLGEVSGGQYPTGVTQQPPHGHINPAQSPNHQQIKSVQQIAQANQMPPGQQSIQQQQQHASPFLHQNQMNNGGNFFQGMPGGPPQGQQQAMLERQKQQNLRGFGAIQILGAGQPPGTQIQTVAPPGQQQVTTSPGPPLMHPHLAGPAQIQAVMAGGQQPQPSFPQMPHLQQQSATGSQAANQVAGGVENVAARSQGGVTQGNQKGGAAVGSKMPTTQLQTINPPQPQASQLSFLGNAAGPHALINQVQQLGYQQALQLLDQGFVHQGQEQIPMASDASGVHHHGLQSMAKMMSGSNYMAGTQHLQPPPHLVGQLMAGQQTAAPNTTTASIQGSKTITGMPTGTVQQQQMTTAPSQASSGTTRGAAGAASVTKPTAPNSQPPPMAQQQQMTGQQQHQTIQKDGHQAPIKQGAVAAAVIGSNFGKTSQQQMGGLNNNSNNSRYAPTINQQIRPEGAQHSSSQVVAGGHGSQTTVTASSSQQSRRGNQHQTTTTGIRGGDKPPQTSQTTSSHGGNNNNSQQPGTQSHPGGPNSSNPSNFQKIQK